MILYWLYRLGYFIANALPLKSGYAVAETLSTLHYYISAKDRNAVKSNMRSILGSQASERQVDENARMVFVNFAKYLVDFFRFAQIDDNYVKENVKLRGLEYVDEALTCGKGVIVLSGHIGNWELGGNVLASLRQPMGAVVLTHKNKKINDFFTSQRMINNMKPIEIGASLRSCYEILKKNGLLALLGDRDFSRNGFRMSFLGQEMLIPKGPAVLSRRLGASIVPCFMTRQSDDSFLLEFSKPILPDLHKDEDLAVKELVHAYAQVIESTVKKYPTQWYMFREAWGGE
jgi:KDO2-lipid IV(A) lauroyltransferase